MRFTRKNLIKRLLELVKSQERDLEFYRKFGSTNNQLQEQRTKATLNAYTWLIWEIENWEEIHSKFNNQA